ncbi:flagellin [Priestia koreensis]|uniref:flagellin N-terminal helical domain-containing protein n=1 Tax=Priestia koreensis TaxID=284581 RepID=UPI003457F192
MRINHNIAALNTYRQLSTAAGAQSKSMEKLASGLRINRAGDDAAGLAISEKMRAQVRGLDQASRNAQDGISMIQTAEGGLNEVHSILQRMRELSDQSANGTNTTEDRKALQDEIKQLKEEIDRIGNTTEFNTQKLLDGTQKSAGSVVGSNSTISSVVGKLAAGKMTAAQNLAADNSTLTFGKDTLEIDGHHIDVDWGTLLTQAQKDSLKRDMSSDSTATQEATADLLTNTLNTAIDNYNATNAAGATVQHVNGYLSSGKIVLESGSKGTSSGVSLFTSSAVTGVGALVLSNTAGDISGGAGTYAANLGTSTYNGSTVANATKFDFTINGINIQTAATGAAITNGTTSMSAAASTLQTAINAGITSYNTTQGKTAGQEGFLQAVAVTVTEDGRFKISSESGTVSFWDRDGQTTVKDLGLDQASTSASGNGGLTFQIGSNRGQTINFGISDMRTAALGLSGLDISTSAGASAGLTSLDTAIKNVSSERAKLGAVQNRLEHTINNLNTSSENLTAAESRIRDVDMAKEMMEQTKNSILSQAAQAMLAQANQQPQGVLQLLR